MIARGHNEKPMRLDMLADDARQGLKRVELGEENVIGGWLAYGFALNEGRALHTSEDGTENDRGFGGWLEANNLRQVAGGDGSVRSIEDHERKAAMWAAANADQFEEARHRGNPRTIRGIHAKWKEIEAEREAERFAEEKRRRAAEAQGPDMASADAAIADVKIKEEAEEKAHAAVNAASDEADRQQAEAVAAKATEDREAAEKAANDAVDALFEQPKDDGSDPYGYAKLTEEALLDLANGLRADLDDANAKRKAAEAEVKALKAKLRDFQDDDKDAVIRRLQASVNNAENAKWKALEDRDAYHRQLFAVKKERDAAIKASEVAK